MYAIELNGHTVGEVFYNGELENELRRINCTDYKFSLNSDRENCMEMVEKTRRDNIYPHDSTHCTEECKKRGKCKNTVTIFRIVLMSNLALQVVATCG